MRATSANALADEIIEIGRKCVTNGVEKVFISGLVICERMDKTRISNINKILESKCVELDFNFIKRKRSFGKKKFFFLLQGKEIWRGNKN